MWARLCEGFEASARPPETSWAGGSPPESTGSHTQHNCTFIDPGQPCLQVLKAYKGQ